jgi:hypothetical protein
MEDETSDDSDFEQDEGNRSQVNDVNAAEMDAAKKREFVDKNKWNTMRFPNSWLVWYLYGPPKACGHPDLNITEMMHLTKIKASRKLNEEEEVVQLGQLHKIVRRKLKSKSRKQKSPGDEDSDTEVGTTVSARSIVNEIKLVRTSAPLTAEERMDKAIMNLKLMIENAKFQLEEDGDEDGTVRESIKDMRSQLNNLLREQMNNLLNERTKMMNA